MLSRLKKIKEKFYLVGRRKAKTASQPPFTQLQRALNKIVIILMMMIIIMVFFVCFFCKWYLKSYFCIRGCLLWHKSTALPANPNQLFSSRLLSPPSSFLILLDLRFSIFCSFSGKRATEMNVLFSAKSILFSPLSLPTYFQCCFASLIFLHSCPCFSVFERGLSFPVCACPRTKLYWLSYDSLS